MRFLRHLLCGLLLIWSVSASAIDIFNLKTDPLPAAQAYQFSAIRQGDIITAHWQMAPGYYLYKKRFCFIVNGQPVSAITLPPAKSYTDSFLGSFTAYENDLQIVIPLTAAEAGKPVHLQVCYQGCSSHHFCYPPVVKQLTLAPQGKGTETGTLSATPPSTEQDKLTSALTQHSVWWSLLSFFGLGLLLTFTPCVLPMIPILSSLILGQQHISTARAFMISCMYVLGMAVTYAIIGIVAGLAGANLQIALQTPLAISLMSLLFIILALSLFGLYDIRLPHWLEAKITHLSNQQKGGNFIGAAIMGCLATLIVSPCVSPALVGAVAFITQTGNYILGGLALFIMALGMGVPLLLVGTFGGRILPHAGNWMNIIKQVFGVLMLMIAILLLDRIMPKPFILLMWAALLIISSVYLGLLQPAITGWSKFWKGVGLLLAIGGGILLFNAAQGSAHFQTTGATPKQASSPFSIVTDSQALNTALSDAAAQNKITLLDFYADWCLSCKEMDWKTFNNNQVKTALQSMQAVRIDITKDTASIQALKKQYGVVAPPTLIFIDAKGNEISNSRIVGGVNAQQFLTRIAHLATIK